MQRTYLGWIVVEENSPFKDVIYVEWIENGNRRRQQIEGGAAEAVEWWDKRAGAQIALEPYGRIGYRVYTK